MTQSPEMPAPPTPADVPPDPLPVLDARRLFGEAREVVIEHEGVRYRLRITRRNKLILQK